MFFYWDPTFLLILPGLLLALYAQQKINSAYSTYSRVSSQKGASGSQAARALLERQGIYDVEVVMGKGQLSDHYDPRTKKVVLSPGVYQSDSLAALAVAAHETGHAIQHNEAYLPLSLRTLMAPVVQIASNVAIPLFILGLFFSYTLTQVGIYLFAAVVLFQLVTLPVEFNASRRAMAALESQGFITTEEYPGAKSVLSAAALTYVAAVMTSILQLMRLLIISGAGRRRD
ncbi:MAG: zinc metallopeptidase [Peptococcaceae bacterium]|nr:zinc metallopeptidase [Peptococcaceae bacterium]